MYLQDILEVALGLVFMWLVLSIGAMTLQEWIGNVFEWRPKALQKSIKLMLNSGELAQKLYDHPLIVNLYVLAQKKGKKPRLPSYIPPGRFSTALFDVITNEGMEDSPLFDLTASLDSLLATSITDSTQLELARGEWQAILEIARQVALSGAKPSSLDSLKMEIQEFKAKFPETTPLFDKSLPQVYAYYADFQTEERSYPPTGSDGDLIMRRLRLGAKAIGKTNSRLKDAIITLLREAQSTVIAGEQIVDKTRQQFEQWFNDAMDRLSGAYKRKAQFASFVIGFFLAILLNMDTINTATTLWREPTLRQAIIAQVTTSVSQNEQAIVNSSGSESTLGALVSVSDLQTQLRVLNFPFGWITTAVTIDPVFQCDLASPSTYDAQGLPVHILGIRFNSLCYPLINSLPINQDNAIGWLTKLLGLLLTGAAAAQGAPFWFDILKKFVNVRSSGSNPSEKPVG